MPEFPETNESLIVRVKDPANQTAWEEFERLYRPVIFRIARAKGMQHSDALDVVQQVLLAVASAIGSYEKANDQVRFRNWLSRVTRNAILKSLTRQPWDRSPGGSNMLDLLSEVPDADAATETLISLEYRRELFWRAADHVRAAVQEPTWLAFELTVLKGMPIEQAAEALAMSIGSVYAARSRVMRKLRSAVEALDFNEVGVTR